MISSTEQTKGGTIEDRVKNDWSTGDDSSMFMLYLIHTTWITPNISILSEEPDVGWPEVKLEQVDRWQGDFLGRATGPCDMFGTTL